MRKQVIAVAVASALAFAVGAFAQQKAGTKAQQMEAVVTVTKIDPAARLVQVRSKSRQAELHLAPDIDMSNIQEGNRYRMRWTEATATAIEPGAQSAAAAGATGRQHADVEKTGPGAATITSKRAGVIDKVDTANRQVTLRTLEGNMETFKLGEGVSPESLKAGEAVTVTYERAVVSRLASTPQPISDPAPAQ